MLFAVPPAIAGGTDPGELRFLSNTRQLIFQGARSGEGYFSDDGSKMIFQAEREEGNPFYQIYILDLEEGESHLVSPGTGKTTCGFFRPGHDEVLFGSTHLDQDAARKQKDELDFRASGKQRRYSWDYDSHMDIFSSRQDGSELKRLTDVPGYDAEGGYSPDGTKIVFSSLRSGYGDDLSQEDIKRVDADPAWFGEIYIMNADGSKQTRLTDWAGYDGGPFFTPDGKRIVWRHFQENGMIADVYTMKLDGSDIRQITDFGAMSWAPYFHPSGEYVIFASNKLGFSNFELYMTDALGKKEPVRVTYTDKFDGLPVFSPDGKSLAWTATRAAEGKTQNFIASWNHAAAIEAIRQAPPRKNAEGGNGGHEAGAGGSADAGSPKAAGSQAGAPAEKKGSESPADHGKAGSGSAFHPKISADDMKTQVEFLAGDEREGRLTGSKGVLSAAHYIAHYFRDIGLEPAGDDKSYFQQFPFTSGVRVIADETALMVEGLTADGPTVFALEKDFRPLPFSASGGAHGELVFAGYGISLPGGGGYEEYDSYAGLDVKDKIVVVLRYFPEDVSVERKMRLNEGAGLRRKAAVARELGARALLVLTGPLSKNPGELVSLEFDRSLSDAGILAASISADLAAQMFAASGKDLEKVQAALDAENPHVETAFSLDLPVRFYSAVEREKSYCLNVIGLLPASSPDPADEYLVVGAHYDHIGYGEIGSYARGDEKGKVHNGADDNGSGTSMVMEIAAALSSESGKKPEKFQRGIIFALWSGEEMGLLGSSWFADSPVVPVEKISAYVNFDMVGRLRNNRLIVQGVGSSDRWPALMEKKNVSAAFDLALQNEPMLYTDVSPFYGYEVPVLSFFTGVHEEYNRPTDKAATLDYEGMVRIGNFARRISVDLVGGDRPVYTRVAKVERKSSGGGGGDRPYLGTIPDYVGGGEEGLLLEGVREGGPAEKGGLRGGDVIIHFAGKTIANIRDFASALDVVKVGEPVAVTVLRDGEEKKFTVVPGKKE